MKTTTKPTATKKAASPKPDAKAARVKARIAKLETIIERYEAKRTKRQAKLAALKTLLASLAK